MLSENELTKLLGLVTKAARDAQDEKARKEYANMIVEVYRMREEYRLAVARLKAVNAGHRP